MNLFLALIGGLGIGSLLTTVVNHFLLKNSENSDRLYREKREAYIGMTRALYDVEIEPGPKNAKAFGYYLNMAKIFGPQNVVMAGQKVIDTDPCTMGRDEALKEFYEAMKNDLRKT